VGDERSVFLIHHYLWNVDRYGCHKKHSRLRQCPDWHKIIPDHGTRSFPTTFGSFRCLRQCQDWHKTIPDHFRTVSLSATMPRLAQDHSRQLSVRFAVCDNAKTDTRSFPDRFRNASLFTVIAIGHDHSRSLSDRFAVCDIAMTGT